MDAPAQFLVDADPARRGWSRLALGGRVVIETVAALRAAALELLAGGTNVCISCAAVEYLDVSAIQILIALGRELRAAGRECEVADVPPAVAKLFRMAGLGGAG
ncbi:MAG: STAS domain-containing protein [Gemmata sp.]